MQTVRIASLPGGMVGLSVDQHGTIGTLYRLRDGWGAAALGRTARFKRARAAIQWVIERNRTVLCGL